MILLAKDELDTVYGGVLPMYCNQTYEGGSWAFADFNRTNANMVRCWYSAPAWYVTGMSEVQPIGVGWRSSAGLDKTFQLCCRSLKECAFESIV